MSKRRTHKGSSRDRGRSHRPLSRKRRTVAAVVGLLVLISATGILAGRRTAWLRARKHVAEKAEAQLAPQSTLNLSKEYVYAGNRLIATEEPGTSGNVAPSAPINVAATAGPGGEVVVGWTPGSSNVDGYKVERSVGTDTAFAQIAQMSAGFQTLSDQQAAADTPNYYRVRAFNAGGGNSPYSNEASAAPASSVPAGPSNLVSNVVSGSEIDLSWTDTSTNESGLKLERSTSSGAFSLIQVLCAGTQTYHDTTVSPGTAYQYRVKAFNNRGDSPYATGSIVNTPGNVPPTPALQIAGQTSSSVSLSWTESATVDSFCIYFSTPDDQHYPGLCTSVPGSSNSYTMTGLVASTRYYFKMFASAGGVSSGFSSEVNTMTLPQAPTNLAASSITGTSLTLTWSQAGTVDSFKIYRNGSQVGTSTSATYSDSGLTPSTTYSYQVQAHRNDAGDSAMSAALPVTTSGGSNCQVTTYSGSGVAGYLEGTGTSAQWYNPRDAVVAKDPQSGNYALFIVDTFNSLIRMVYLQGASAGASTLLAGTLDANGNPVSGYSGGHGNPLRARYSNPRGITAITDSTGTATAIIIGDTGNNMIREVSWNGNAWVPSDLAGITSQSNPPPAGQYVDGNASINTFLAPEGVAFGSDGYIYVADDLDSAIRKLDQSGTSTTVYRNGGLGSPIGIAYSLSTGLLYVTDAGIGASGSVLWKINQSGPTATILIQPNTLLNGVGHVAWSNSGGNEVLYIGDTGDYFVRLYQVSSGSCTTYAGTTWGSADGACATVAQFRFPYACAVGTAGELYVMDSANNQIRKVQ